MRITPEALEAEFSLSTAATRLDFLSRRDGDNAALNSVRAADEDDWSSLKSIDTSLDTYEALELLALGEVVARKAHDSQLIGVRAALRGGAGWDEIATALGTTPDGAYDAFQAAVARQLEADEAASARELAGARPGPDL
jgi:hypothetical protein